MSYKLAGPEENTFFLLSKHDQKYEESNHSNHV